MKIVLEVNKKDEEAIRAWFDRVAKSGARIAYLNVHQDPPKPGVSARTADVGFGVRRINVL